MNNEILFWPPYINCNYLFFVTLATTPPITPWALQAFGPDGIPNTFLRNLADQLTDPMLLIFNKPLTDGIFPSQWRDSFVMPIFKSGDRSLCKNYRDISLLSASAKVLEIIVCRKLEDAIGARINTAQHGFRASRLTATNLVSMVEYGLSS